MPMGKKTAARREAALGALLSEPTLEQAARKAGVSEKTLRLWLKEGEFTRAYREARRQVVEAAVARLQQGASKAVEALENCLAADRPSDKIKAAAAILDRAIKGVELIDLEERMAELERRMSERGPTS